MKTITDKMTARGVESLSDAELLAVLTDDEQTAGALLAVDHDTLEEGTDPPPGKEQQEQRPGKPEDGKQGHDDP